MPSETFIVEVTGTTLGGAGFVRDVTVPAQPQSVAVEAFPSASTARPGTTAGITVRIRNLGPVDATYQLQVLSSLGWLVTGPSAVMIPAAGSAEVRFSVQVPADATEGTANVVTFLAQDSTLPRTRNSASVTVIAGAVNQPPECSGAVAHPRTLSNPNHRMRSIEIQGVSDPDGDAIALTVDKITQDEPVCRRDQECHQCADGIGVGTSTPSLRAERNKKGDGRVYEVTFTASDGRGESCTGAVRVGVPRHHRKAAVDSGQNFDSTVGCDDDDDDDDDDVDDDVDDRDRDDDHVGHGPRTGRVR